MDKLATGADGKVHPALLDAIKQDMRVVLRELITGKGDNRTGAQAVLEQIDADKNLQANIRSIIGDEETNRLVKASRQLYADIESANELAAAGSRTSRDLESQHIFAEVAHGTQPGGIIHKFITAAMKNGRTMTAEEGQAMIDLLHGDPHTLMDVIEAKPDGLVAQGVRLGLARAAGGYVGGRQGDAGQGDPMPPVERMEDQPAPPIDDMGIAPPAVDIPPDPQPSLKPTP
jgi:hypothetical protein